MTEEGEKEKSFTFVDKRKSHEDEDKTAQEPAPSASPEETSQQSPNDKKTTQAPLPELDFNFFILSLSSSAMMQMGVIPNPTNNKKEINMEMAKQTIDMITMLENKTKGNLTEEEDKFLSSILYDLRIKFVELSKEQG